MLVIIFMMFVSASTGYAACVAFCRGLTGTSKNNLGNFYVDLVRITTRILIPFSIIVTLILVWQGAPRISWPTRRYHHRGHPAGHRHGPHRLPGLHQAPGHQRRRLPGRQLHHPLENPTIISDITELLSMMILPGACVIMFGLMYHNRKKLTDEAHPVVGRRLTDRQPIFGGEAAPCSWPWASFSWWACACATSLSWRATPSWREIGLSQSMERHGGQGGSASASPSPPCSPPSLHPFTTGTVNNMHDTLTPLGGMVPLLAHDAQLRVRRQGRGPDEHDHVRHAGRVPVRPDDQPYPQYLGKKVEAAR